MVFILTRFLLHWLPEFIENKENKTLQLSFGKEVQYSKYSEILNSNSYQLSRNRFCNIAKLIAIQSSLKALMIFSFYEYCTVHIFRIFTVKHKCINHLQNLYRTANVKLLEKWHISMLPVSTSFVQK